MEGLQSTIQENIQQCFLCLLDGHYCKDKVRRSSARDLASQIDSQGNLSAPIEGFTKKNMKDQRQNLRRLKSSCPFFSLKHNDLKI